MPSQSLLQTKVSSSLLGVERCSRSSASCSIEQALDVLPNRDRVSGQMNREIRRADAL